MSDKYAGKVAALFRKAESTDNEHERESFMQKAYELMERHSIDEILLAKAQGDAAPVKDTLARTAFEFKGVYSIAWVMMVHQVGMALDCKTIKYKGKGSDLTARVVGYQSDIDRLHYLMATLTTQANRAVERHLTSIPGYSWMTASEKYNAKRSFLIGFGNGVHEKLMDAKRVVLAQEQSRGSGAEIVLRDRAKEVTQFYNREFPGSRTGRGPKVTGSYSSGQAAGRRADTGGTSLGGGRRQLPR